MQKFCRVCPRGTWLKFHHQTTSFNQKLNGIRNWANTGRVMQSTPSPIHNATLADLGKERNATLDAPVVNPASASQVPSMSLEVSRDTPCTAEERKPSAHAHHCSVRTEAPRVRGLAEISVD